VDDRLKSLVEELGVAINNSISASEQIPSLIATIQDAGYEVSFLLNATIAIARRQPELANSRSCRSGRIQRGFDPEDIQFLKSMHISVNGPAL
jgi:hypothetical protein